jgi:hypothetical protein
MEPTQPTPPPMTMARFSRRLDGCQWLGLTILLVGVALLIFAFHVGCDPAEDGCDNEYSWQLFDAGFVCISLFCCVPSFALTDPELFYNVFPGLREKMGRRFRDAADHSGEFNSRGASMV